MEIYLIRHTTPAIDKGICYGQSDVDVTNSFAEEALPIKNLLPPTIQAVYSSPLKRCRQLSEFLFPDKEIHYCENLKEIKCGEWELKNWDDIDKDELNFWMKDFVMVPFPKGENFFQFSERVISAFETITQISDSPIAIVTHAGVIRSLLSFITGSPLKESFNTFKLSFGSVVLIQKKTPIYSYRIVTSSFK
jgi:alpha-ribazole phosphatase